MIEKRLLESLRKPTDGLISRHLNRHLSLQITRLIMPTRIRPNHVSLVTLLLALSCGLVIAQGGYVAGVLGALLLQTQSVVDGVDGELARLKLQGSRLGEWLDTISDDLAELSFLSGAVWIEPQTYFRWLGVAGIASFVVVKSIQYFILATVMRSGDLLKFQWSLGEKGSFGEKVKWLFKHDFFCLLTLLLALFNRIDMALVLGSLGAIGILLALIKQLSLQGARPSHPRPEGKGE